MDILEYLQVALMDTRGIINLRAWREGETAPFFWDSYSRSPKLGKGVSLPQEGTGVRDCKGVEIFRGDLVTRDGGTFLIGYIKGAYRLQDLQGEDVGGWLHDQDSAGLEVVGNSRVNSAFVAHCILERVGRRREVA